MIHWIDFQIDIFIIGDRQRIELVGVDTANHQAIGAQRVINSGRVKQLSYTLVDPVSGSQRVILCAGVLIFGTVVFVLRIE